MKRDEYNSRRYEFAARGEKCNLAKTDEETVKKVRKLAAKKKALLQRINEKYSYQAIADQTGLPVQTVNNIINFRTWVHVK